MDSRCLWDKTHTSWHCEQELPSFLSSAITALATQKCSSLNSLESTHVDYLTLRTSEFHSLFKIQLLSYSGIPSTFPLL